MSTIRAQFAEAVSLPDDQIDLAHAALLFAADESSGVDIGKCLTRLDFLAAAASERLDVSNAPEQQVERLARFLHEDQGFRGNSEDYSDPRNSYLNEVLDRRLGIPISLSLVWLEVAKRLELPIVGVGLPGHFIVKWRGNSKQPADILIDPFHGGRIITRCDCMERVQEVYGEPVVWHDHYTCAVSNREILARMLRNLKASFAQRGECNRVISIIQKILMVKPESAEDVRDLGLMHLQRQETGHASDCLERYLRLSPRAHDTENVKEIIRAIRCKVAQWN